MRRDARSCRDRSQHLHLRELASISRRQRRQVRWGSFQRSRSRPISLARRSMAGSAMRQEQLFRCLRRLVCLRRRLRTDLCRQRGQQTANQQAAGNCARYHRHPPLSHENSPGPGLLSQIKACEGILYHFGFMPSSAVLPRMRPQGQSIVTQTSRQTTPSNQRPLFAGESTRQQVAVDANNPDLEYGRRARWV